MQRSLLFTFPFATVILFQSLKSSNPTCDTSEQCSSSIVSCVEGEDCFVDCIAYRACFNATIECPSTSHNCRIYCEQSGACNYAQINSSSSHGGNLTVVNGLGDWQLSQTQIFCPNGGSCSVNCASEVAEIGGCNGMTVYGQQAKRVYIDTGKGGTNGLRWTKIYCPHNSNGAECTIVVQNTMYSDQIKGMQIYAIESLNDVSVTCKPATSSWCYPENDPPIMHYTLTYNESCEMDLLGQDQWNCIYPTIAPTLATWHPTPPPLPPPMQWVHPTKIPTLTPTTDDPTTEPTNNPTTDPTNDPTDDPTNDPTTDPTNNPTLEPTLDPTTDPTTDPTNDPTNHPTNDPTLEPTLDPTKRPTPAPIACPYNEFSFSESLSCFRCHADADGYECKGQNILTVQSGFWISAVSNSRQSFGEFIPLSDKRFNAINYSLVSLRCPPGQCCDDDGGCSYYDLNSDNVRSNALCAAGRNISSVTCSECNDGLYTLIGTTMCGRCDSTNYPLLCLPLVSSFIFVIFMIFVFSKPIPPVGARKEIDWRRLFIRDESAIINILVFKITLYFYQSLSQILFTKNITPATHIERSLLAIGNFDIFYASSASGFCVIGQIQSGLHQLLISQIFYAFLILDLLIILLMSRVYNVSLYSFCCCFACCMRKSRLQSYKPFIKTGAINILMMCAGPILSLCFKLLTPINIGDRNHARYYHFYDATKPCYRFIWFVAFICTSFICIIVISWWYSVRQQSPEQRGDVSNEYRSLINKYASHEWYWEFVLFARRFVIAVFTAIETNAMTSVVLGLFIMILLMAQVHFKPFRYDRANYVESLCLLSLGSIILCLNIPVTGVYVRAMSIYVSVLILTPIVVILLLCVRILYRLCKFRMRNNADISFSKELVAIEKIITRMPTKDRSAFKQDIKIQLQQTTDKKDTIEGEGCSPVNVTPQHAMAAFDIEKKRSVEILSPENEYQNESVSSIEVKYH